MIRHNSYFDGQVQSLALQGHSKPATVGVMAQGNYEFGTDAAEKMSVVQGELQVLLPDTSDWQVFTDGQSFDVPANSKFSLKVPVDTAYLCIYG